MGLAELIEVVKDLPEAQQNEVIDFAEFVAKKCGVARANQQQSNADTGMTFAQMLLSMPRLDASEWHEGLFERDQTACREVEF